MKDYSFAKTAFTVAAVLWLACQTSCRQADVGAPVENTVTDEHHENADRSRPDELDSRQHHPENDSHDKNPQAMGQPVASALPSVKLIVQVSGIKEKGTIRIAVFDQPDGFPDANAAVRLATAKAREDGVTVAIEKMMPGTYAIAAFHDLDEDGILSTNLVGIPTEPYGFSGDSRGRFGPPSFSDVAFELSVEDGNITVILE